MTQPTNATSPLACEPLEPRRLFSTTSPSYTVTNLGAALGGDTVPYAINDSGYVVGTRTVGGVSTGFAYNRGAVAILPAITAAEAVNAAGMIVGHPPGRGAQVFATGAASSQRVYALGTVVQAAINDQGLIAGTYTQLYGIGPTAFVSVAGQPARDIGTAGASRALAVNDAGVIAGTDRGRAVLFNFADHRRNVVIGNLFPGMESTATDVNDRGHATGHVTQIDLAAGVADNIAFLYTSGKVRRLAPTPGFDEVEPTAMNNSDVIVGVEHSMVSGASRAFVFAAGKMSALNTLIDPALGVVLVGATDVNTSGQITAYGYNARGHTQAFLLTPVRASASPAAAFAAIGSAEPRLRRQPNDLLE